MFYPTRFGQGASNSEVARQQFIAASKPAKCTCSEHQLYQVGCECGFEERGGEV